MRSVVFLPLLMLLTSGCTRSVPPSPTAADASASSARTAWVAVRPPEGQPFLTAPALVLPAPEAAAEVTVPFRARVGRIRVRAGDAVDRGEVLVEVVMPEAVQAAGAYVAAGVRVEAYRKRRAQLLALQPEGLVRISDLSEAEVALAEAEADRTTAAATLRSAGIDPGGAAALVSSGGATALRSPITGVVSRVSVTAGAVREPGGGPLVQVSGPGEVRIEARLAPGWPEEAPFTFRAPGGPEVPVHLLRRDAVVDRDGTRKAWFGLGAGTAVTAGTTGVLQARAEQRDLLVVPARAVRLREGQSEVVRRGPSGRPEAVPVTVVSANGTDALVRGALGPEDRVAEDAALAPDGTGRDGS